MNLKELLAKLLAKKFATLAEKAQVRGLFKALEEEAQEEVAGDVSEVAELPEEAPVDEEEKAKEEVEETVKNLFADAKGEIVSEVKEAMSAELKVAEKRAGLYKKDVQGKRKELNGYTRKFLRALVQNDIAQLKEMTTDDSGTPYAGYVVDSELSAEIRHLMTEYGVSRREMTGVQLSKGDYKANNLATDLSVNWTEEAGTIASTQVVLGQGTLSLNKLTAIVTLTNELLEDEEIDLVSFIAGRVAEGFAQAEDEAFFKGDGTSTYGSFTGLLENASVNEEIMTGTGFSSVDADDFSALIDATPQGALKNAKFYLNRTIMSYIRKLKASDGTYIYQMPSAGGPGTVWGYPVVLVEAMPTSSDSEADTSFVLFGDLKKACLLGYKGGIKAEMFNAGVVRNVADSADINLITSDRKAVRWVERVGYLVIVPTAVSKLTTASASA